MTASGVSDEVEDVEWITVDHLSSAGTVRRQATSLARRLGFHDERTAGIAIVATELATNQVKHAGSGNVLLRVRRGGGEAALELVAVDSGPGIADVEYALTDGNSTAGTLGIGMGAFVRLASGWDLYSRPGMGTVVTTTFANDPARRSPAAKAAGLTRPMAGQDVCGDAYALRVDDGVVSAMLADGLGHGPMAAKASQEAVRAFRAAPVGPPTALLTAVHRALHGTRGAAVAVAQVSEGTVRYAGIGNIAGTVLDDTGSRGMISHPGIAGAQARTIRENTYPIGPGGLVVMYSDGLTARMDLAPYVGLRAKAPLTVATVLMRDFGVRQDDASTLVVGAAASR
jgi:anti-sigma regulatory factor (Ser/Thr protein kinase)